MLRTQEFLSMGICRGMTQVQSQFPHINLNWFYDFFFHFHVWSQLTWYMGGRHRRDLQAEVLQE